MAKPVTLFICLLLIFSSCLHNKIRYIIEKDEEPGLVTEYPNKPPDYFIKQKDILYIKISSANEEINKILNIESNQMSSMNAIEGNPFYLNGINVNDSGNISLPVIGSFHVEGKKIDQVQAMIQQKVDERMNNTEVKVSLVSFNLTFLGEFNKQGKYTIMQDNLNILDAIGIAGGMNDYGNKKNVLVLRKVEEGTKAFKLDLTDRSLLTNKQFFLMPDDIIIAEPLKNKSFQLGVKDYTLLLTTITSTITMVLLVITLLQ